MGDGEPAVALRALQHGQRTRPVESGVDLDLIDAGVHQAIHLGTGLMRRADDLGHAGPAPAGVAVEQRAGADQARRARVRPVPVLAPRDRLLERATHVAHRGHAVGQVEGRVPVLRVHVHVDEPRQDEAASHVHALDGRFGRQLRRRQHGGDARALHVDCPVGQPSGRAGVEHLPADQRELTSHRGHGRRLAAPSYAGAAWACARWARCRPSRKLTICRVVSSYSRIDRQRRVSRRRRTGTCRNSGCSRWARSR